MTETPYLRVVPPVVELDEGEGGGDDSLYISISISSDDGSTDCSKTFPADTPPASVATALLMAMRGVLAAYHPDVQLEFERLLLSWKGKP